jgi:1-acyl-sn-glycerol-3-phosphate acyltransferase
MGALLHGLIGWPLFIAVSLLNFFVGIGVQLAALPFDPKRRIILQINRLLWGRTLYGVQPLWTLRRIGFEHIGAGPYIVVCNHMSVLDIPASMLLPVPVRVVGRHQLFNIPMLGWYMRFSRQIPLDPTSPESIQRFLEVSKESLADGISVVIFPEGTRSDGRLGRFRSGAFRLALETGVPVLPLAIDGTQHILPKKVMWPVQLRATVRLQALEPVDPRGYATPQALADAVRQQMEQVMETAAPAHAA